MHMNILLIHKLLYIEKSQKLNFTKLVVHGMYLQLPQNTFLFLKYFCGWQAAIKASKKFVSENP